MQYPHTHTNAEHKGPGFSIYAGPGANGGYQCNGTSELTDAERVTPANMTYKGVEAGDTIEVHWVHSSCDVSPGEGLGSCLAEGCTDPMLRVETQVFLVVNDETALNFMDMDYSGAKTGDVHQAKFIPGDTGEPVVFKGSTTGPSYNNEMCSPLRVTWSVRPNCAKLDINSLNDWAESNVFNEDHSHGVRELVTQPEFLSSME